MKLLQSSVAIEEANTYTSIGRKPIIKIRSTKKKKAVKKMYLGHEKHNNTTLQHASTRKRTNMYVTSAILPHKYEYD